jgi:hypothetical protein
MSLSPFDGPIPGQSLTAEPGNAPWEKPSKFSDPLDAFEMYMEKLGDEEVIDDVMDMLDIGVPVSVVAGTMLSMGVMEGMHTVDVKLLLKPLLMTQIKTLADVTGVDYKMTMADYRDKDAEAEQRRRAKLAAKLAQRTGAVKGTPDMGEQIVQEAQTTLEEPTMEEQQPMAAPEAPQGLMAKEQM